MANYDFVFNVGANADSFVKDIIEKYKETQAMITADGLIVKYSGDPKSLKEVINNIRNADPTATITFQADKKSMERILEGVDISGIKFNPKKTDILKQFQDVINAAGKQLDGVNLTGYFTDVTSAFIDENKSAKDLYDIVKRTTDAINMLINSSNKQGLKGLDQNELENIIKKMRERIELEKTLQKTSDEIRNKYQKDDEEVRSSVIEKAQKRKYNVGDIKKDRESLGFSDSVYNQLKEKDKDTLNQFIKNTKYLKQEFEKRKQYQDINKDITTTKDAEDLINKRKQLYNLAHEIKQQTKDMENEKLFKGMGLDKILAQINDELEAGISRLINIKTSKIQTNIRNAGNDIDNQLSIYQEKRIKSAGKDLERTQEKAEKNRKKDEKNYGAGRRSKGRSEGGSGYGDGEGTGAGGIGGGTGKDSGVTGEFKEATGAAEEFGEAGRAAGQAVASSVREASEAVQDLNRKIKEAEDKLKELQSGVDAKQLKSKDFGGLIQGAIDDAERLIADIDASDDEISKAQQRVLDLAATARSLGEMPRMGEKYDNLYETYQMDNEDYEEKILKKIVDPKAIQEQEELIRKLKSDLEAELSKSGVSGGGHGSITGASKDEIDELQKALSELPDSKEILIKVNNETALPSIEEVETVLDKIPDTKTIKISAIDYDKIPLLSDALGNIIDVYRGMHGVFGSTGKGGISWFADQLEVAAGYADDLQEDGKIIKANLAFKNPLEIMGNGAAFDKLDMSEMSSEFKEAAEKMGFDVKKMVTDDVVAVAKSIGRDGVIFRDIMDSYGDVVHNVYATIDQIQVKNEELRGIVRKNTGELELLDKTDNSQSPSSTILSQQQIYGDIQDAINSHEYTFVAKLDKEASNIGIDIQDEIDSHSPYRTKVRDDKKNKDLDINKEVLETPASKFVEQAKKDVEQTKSYINALNSDVQRMDPDGIVSKYLFGSKGVKNKQQLVSEIQNEVKTIDDFLQREYLNGKLDHNYEKEFNEPFKKLRMAQAFGQISYNDKILPDYIQSIYDQWFHKNSGNEDFDKLDDDQMSFWGGMIDAQERLNALQQNGGKDYIAHLERVKQLNDQIQEARERNATFQKTDIDSDLTQEQANEKAEGLLKEKAALDQLILSVEQYRSDSKIFSDVDSWFGNYLSDTSGLKTMSEMLEDEADNLKIIDLLRNRKQNKIYNDAVDYKFKGKHGAPKELEDYWEQIDGTFYPRQGLAPLTGEEAIEKLNQKAKDLGVTFDETQKKWVELSSSTETPQTPDNEEKIDIKVDTEGIRGQVEAALADPFEIDIKPNTDGLKDGIQDVIKSETKSATQESDLIDRIAYHYGNISSGKLSHQFGDEISAWFSGKRNGGRGWSDGTGTYVTSDASQYSNGDFSNPLKQFYAIDTSNLKLFEAHTEETAEQYYNFIHQLEQFCIKVGSGFDGFDSNLQNIDTTSLYQTFQKVFPDIKLTFEGFNSFISDMTALVQESGLKSDGSFNAKQMFDFKKKNGADDIKTRFMKMLGFQGTDLSGTSFDSLRDGSVLFDTANIKDNIIKTGKTVQDVITQTKRSINQAANIQTESSGGENTLKQKTQEITEEGEAAEKAKQQKEDFAKANEHISQVTDPKPIEKATDKIDDEGEAAKKAKKEKEDFADANEKIADVTDAGSIEQASDAINDEAESASKAKKEKEEFAKANEHVADSANETAEETKDAIKDIENESEAVDKGGWGSDQITELLGNISHLKETIDGISTSFTDFAGSLDVSGAIEGMQNLSEAIDEVKGKIESLTTATEGLDLEGLGKAFGKEEITQSLTNTLDKLEEVKGVFSQGFGLGEAGAEAPINNLITAFERLARILEIIQAKGKIDIDLGEDAQQVSDNLNTDKDKADTKNKKNITNETGTKMKQVLDEIYEENQRLGIPKITIEQWQRVLAVAGKYKDQLGDIVDIHRSMLDQNDETSTRYDIKTTNGTFRVYDSGAVKDSAKMGDLLSEQKAQEKQAADAEKKLHQYSSAVKDVVKAQEALDFSKAADKSVLVERLDDAKKKAAELREELTSVVHAIELLSNERKSSLYKELAESLSIEGDPTKATSYQSKANNEKLSDAKKKLKAYEDAVEKVVKLESQINANDITGKNNLGLVRQLQEVREEAGKTKQELKEVASVFYQEFAKGGDIDYKQKISEINEELSNPKASKMYLEKEYEAIEAAIVDCYKAAKKFEDIQEKYSLGETSKRQLDNARANLDKASKTAEDAYKRLKPDNSDHYNRATGLMDYTRNIKNISPSNIDAGFATEEQAWQTLTKYAERYAKVKQKQSEGNVLNYSDLTFLDKYGEKFNEYINKINTLRSVGATLNEFQQGFVDKLGAAQSSALENYLDRIEHEVEELNDLQVNNAGKEAIDKIKRAWDEAAESVRKYGQESEQAQGKITTYNTLKSDFNDRYKEGYYTGANQKDIETLRRRMNEWLYNNPAATTAAAEFKKMFDEIDRGVSEGRLNELKAQFERVKSEAYEAGEVGQTFAGTLKKSFGGLARYLMTYVSFYDFINMMRQAVNIVKELDTAFTEMRKVSDEPLSVLREFSKVESFDIANQVGTTSQQVQQSTADFLRLGESFEQAKRSAKEATVLLNVSEFSDINEATDALTAMSQAYKQLDKEQIIDKLNYIGNNYSISTSELAQSLEKSAGTLSVAANNFDEAIALTVAGNAVLRDPLTVGQSLKTISLRLNGTDIQTLEAEGEETEGAITTKSKLRQKILDLTKVAKNGFKGIDILDENGNYRTTYENLLAIAEVFEQIGEEDKKLGTNRQSALLEVLAQICENMQKCILRIYLIAGNTLEPFTTITEKSRYDGFITKGLVVLQRSTVMS